MKTKLSKLKLISFSLLGLIALASCETNSDKETNSKSEESSIESIEKSSSKENETNSSYSNDSKESSSSSTSSQNSESSQSSEESISTTPIINEDGGIDVRSYSGANECAYIEFNVGSSESTSNYTVSYSQDNKNYTNIDNQLLSKTDSKIRADILGLKATRYYIKVENKNTGDYAIKTIDVQEFDRSGYAHHKNDDGVGAYNNDGTLKTNTVVVYVSNETKNTVKATIGGKSYTGLVAILQAQKNSSNPLDIRILDSIKTNQYKEKSDAPRLADNSNLQLDTFFDNELETTYGDNLVGLTVQYMDKYGEKSYKHTSTIDGLSDASVGSSSKKTCTYNRSDYSEITGQTVYDDDSYFNMLDISDASNVTIEGVGLNAEIFQWGFTWKSCKSIEIKNLTFTDYPEDACSFQGSGNSTSSVNTYGKIWVHNNTFNRGKNNWDISGERDKYAGDGCMDLYYLSNLTLSYNYFYKCKKTGLVGGGNDILNRNITFHHNYYKQVESRLPLGRQANMHIYNNYYENCGTCQDIRANAFVYSEYNYFDSCSSPHLITTDDTYKYTAIKSYNDYVTGGTNKATIVTNREQTVSGQCKPDGSTDYTNFDTNSKLFYYDTVGKCSDVEILTPTDDLMEFVYQYTGAGIAYYEPLIREIDESLVSAKAEAINDLNALIKNNGTYYELYQTKKTECDAIINKYTSLINAAKKTSAVQALYDEALVEFNNLTKTSYTITFIVNNTTYDTVEAFENEAVVLPSSPTQSGKYFSYWADVNGNRFKGIANNNITLYAVFDEFVTYNDLINDSNLIINDNFDDTTSNQKLESKDVTKTQAYGGTNGSDSSLCYGIYTGSSIQTVDNDSNGASLIGYTFGQEYNSGIIKGYITITTGDNIGSKWKLLAFYNNDNTEQVAFGLDSNKNWAYSVNGSDWITFSTVLQAKAKTTYNLYYQIDLDTGLVSLYINNGLYASGINTNATSISYLQTMTNGNGTGSSARVITLDNIILIKQD